MFIGKHLSKLVFDKEFKAMIEFLRKVTLFDSVSDRALGRLLSIMHSKKYPAGEIVFAEGQEGKLLYVIKSGEVEVSNRGKPICRLKEGEFFGEMALLEEIPRTATVTAVKDSELLLMYKIKFDELLDNYPAAGVIVVRNIAAMLSSRIRQIQQGPAGRSC